MTEPDVRQHLALALDVDVLEDALSLADRLQPYFSVAKIGLELYAAAGTRAVDALRERGFRIFLDVKLHDIPTTVGRAARVLGRLGPSYLTVHAAGGTAMLAAAVEGLGEGARDAGSVTPVALAVTVLTSEVAPVTLMAERLDAALAANCGGVVSAASDLAMVRERSPELLAVVPGIRLPGGSADDQERVATPGQALAGGAHLLVIGRAVTAASAPEVAANTLIASLDHR